VTGRRGRRSRELLDDLNKRRGCSHLKKEALDRAIWRAWFGRCFGPVVRQRAIWRAWFGRCFGPVVRQTTKLINIFPYLNTDTISAPHSPSLISSSLLHYITFPSVGPSSRIATELCCEQFLNAARCSSLRLHVLLSR
jgi:hypothetical protein